MRPAPLSEVAGPQERVQRRTVEQITEFGARAADSRRSRAAGGEPSG